MIISTSLRTVGLAGIALILACEQSKEQPREHLPPLYVGVVDVALGGGPGGDADHISHGEFTDIRGIAVDSAARSFVADYGADAIYAFGPGGEYLYTIGRPGAGAGDLRGPCCLSVAADGQLWVHEFGNRRYTAFLPSATRAVYVRSVRMPSAPTGRLDPIAWWRDGRLLHYGSPIIGPDGSVSVVRTLVDSVESAQNIDTLRTPSAAGLGAIVIGTGGDIRRGSSSGVSVLQPPFSPTFLRAFGPRGIFADAISSTYDVTIHDADGVARRRVQRPVPRVALSQKERDRVARIIAAIVGRYPEVRGRLHVPQVKPPLAGLGITADGRVWVELAVADTSVRKADIYSSEGVWERRATWPREIDLSLWNVGQDFAMGVRSDSLGRESVVKLRFRLDSQ